MRARLLLSTFFYTLVLFSFAQNKEPKKNAKETLEQLPDMLLAQPDKVPDTLADKFVNFNLQLTIPTVWKEKGAQIFSDFKVTEADKDPVRLTLPVPEKKIAQSITVTMNTSHLFKEKKPCGLPSG